MATAKKAAKKATKAAKTKVEVKKQVSKEYLKVVWDWYDKNIKNKQIPFVKPIAHGISIKGTFEIALDGQEIELYDYSYDFSFTNEAKALLKQIGLSTETYADNYDPDNLSIRDLPKYLELERSWLLMIDPFTEADIYLYNIDDYNSFNNYWEGEHELRDDVEEQTGGRAKVVLNEDYTAIVDKDSGLVRVGCQTFTKKAIEQLWNALK